MKEKTSLLNMFSDYEPPESLKCVLSQAAISAADLDPESRHIYLTIEMEQYLEQHTIDQICKDIAAVYSLRGLELSCTYPSELLHTVPTSELMQMFVQENSMCRGSLAGAKWEWQDNKMIISLLANGKAMLEECSMAVGRKLREQFGVHVTFEIIAGESLEGDALFRAMEEIRSRAAADIPVASPVQKQMQTVSAQSDMIYGKSAKGQTFKMNELSLNSGKLAVEGKVFAINHKELTKRGAWVVSFA